MTLGERIASLRGRRSQVSLAAAAGIDAATLNRIERGRIKNPQETTLKAIARALGVTLRDITNPDAKVVHGVQGPQVFTASELPGELGQVVNALRLEIRDVLNIAWDARGTAEAAQGKADEALRQLGRRGSRSA